MRRLLLLLSLLVLTTSALAQTQAPPSLMNFQGRLAKPDGTPVSDGSYSVRFSLWNAVSGGAELWSQTSSTTVHNGVFTILLNVGTGLENGATAATLFDGNLWLEIKVGSDPALTPRQPLASVAYALKAATVPDGSITQAKLAPGAGGGANGTAGGDLTGTYPNPALKTDASLLYKVSGTLISALSGANNSPDQAQLQAPQNVLDSAWQSFKPSQDGSLTALDIYTGTISGSPHAAQLVLYDGEGTGGAELGRVTVNVTATPGFQFFTLAVPIAVVAGHQYTWYLGRSSSLTFGYATQDPYSAGRADIGSTLDYAFRTYMTTGGGARISVNADLSLIGRTIELGAGQTKAPNAGKIGYELVTLDALDLFGAGTTTANRKVQIWDEGGLTLTGSALNNATSLFALQVFNPGNVTYPNSDPAGPVPGLSITHVVDPNLMSGYGRSINVAAGSDANSIGAGVLGGTVSGGGTSFITSATKFPNTVTANFGTVSGGLSNTVSGFGGTVAGGGFNTAAGRYSFAAGNNAHANADNSFVWSDGNNFTSAGGSQFLVSAANGVGINTNNPNGFALNVNGDMTASTATIPTFKGNPTFSGSPTFSSDSTVNGNATVHGNAFFTGSNNYINGVLTIDSGNLSPGYFQLGDSNPSLRFGSNSGEGIVSGRSASSGNKFGITFQTSYMPRMAITNSGNVGIGITTPAFPLQVNGIVAGTSFQNTSDARYKTHIITFDNALDTLSNLRGVTFDWRRSEFPDKNFPEGRQIGFIAQEVEKVLPELVKTDGSGYKSVAYANVVPVLVEGVKTLKAQLDDKQKQIDVLQAQVKELATLKQQDARIKELEKQLAEVLTALKQGKNPADTADPARK